MIGLWKTRKRFFEVRQEEDKTKFVLWATMSEQKSIK